MKERFNKLKTSPSYSGLVLMVAALVVYFLVQYIQDPGTFFTVKTYNNFAALFKNYTPLILITMAQALLMLMGIIDISIGIQLSFANVLAVMLPEWTGMPVALAWVLTVCASVVLATINGLVVSYLRIPPLLAGYAMIYIVKGINLLIRPAPGGSVPTEINRFYDHLWGGVVPTSVIIIFLCYLGWMYLKRTPLLHHVYAIGGNERNAFATGINSAATKVKVYAIAGLLTGIAGLCYTAAYSTGNPITGEAYGLRAISACSWAASLWRRLGHHGLRSVRRRLPAAGPDLRSQDLLHDPRPVQHLLAQPRVRQHHPHRSDLHHLRGQGSA